MILDKLQDLNFLNSKISELKQISKGVDIQLLEKTIGALAIVELLSINDVQFVFKGGTSLLLLLGLKRFSVDVDIITETGQAELEKTFQKIVDESIFFDHFEIDERDNAASKRMKLKHYRFYFTSIQDGSKKYILLDVAFESNVYSKTLKKNIKCDELEIDSDVNVILPTIESVLGDKLTVLAPHTTGIQYDSFKELEMIKQLFDVSNLFDSANDIKEIKESFISIANREIAYRKLENISHEDVLLDIQEYCEDIIYLKNNELFTKLARGLTKAKSYLIAKNFVLDIDGLCNTSKILYLTSLIKNEKQIERYSKDKFDADKIDISEFDKTKQKRLKTIKKVSNEAFYYLAKFENKCS